MFLLMPAIFTPSAGKTSWPQLACVDTFIVAHEASGFITAWGEGQGIEGEAVGFWVPYPLRNLEM